MCCQFFGRNTKTPERGNMLAEVLKYFSDPSIHVKRAERRRRANFLWVSVEGEGLDECMTWGVPTTIPGWLSEELRLHVCEAFESRAWNQGVLIVWKDGGVLWFFREVSS